MRKFIGFSTSFLTKQYFFATAKVPNTTFKDIPSDYTFKIESKQFYTKQKTFRVIDLQGTVVAPEYDNIKPDILNKIFETMIRVEEMDQILYMSQRQGKISFYMTSFGETAVSVGTGAALSPEDFIYTQYREQGTFIWRGYTIQDIINQCAGNHEDPGKGRQMPMHFGSKSLNMPTISSPLTTQVPQASGAGYGFRIGKENRIAVAFFGEGAASEGDFHSALNFAATLNSQTLFICRNNKYAISTAADEQYHGESIIGHGPAYGIRSLKVDGNDVLAVYQAVQYARDQILKHREPFMIEFMTYRIGDHSTSDHSVLYRTQEEIDAWKANNNPITRLGLYLKKSGKRQFDDNFDKDLRLKVKEEVIQALKKGTSAQYGPISDLFNDVYDVKTSNLIEQEKELNEHLAKYGSNYDLQKFKTA